MSAYVTLPTPMVDTEALVAALEEVGFARGAIEVHVEPVALEGYGGEARALRAHVVIRRKHVGPAANDIGFERTEAGFRAHVSEYDRGRYGREWLARVHARHDKHHRVALERLAAEERRREEERREEERRRLVEARRASIYEKARKLGYRVEEKREGEKIRLVLVKRVY